MCKTCNDISEVTPAENILSNLVGSDIFSDIQQFKTVVCYHKDCMDGIGAAAMFYQAVKNHGFNPENLDYFAVQYGDLYMPTICEYELIIFVDFCPSATEISILETEQKLVYVFDHHETAMKNCKEIVRKDSKNIRVFFDMGRSGTLIVHDILLKSRNPKISILDYIKGVRDNSFKLSMMANYISDRDLYTFNIYESREFNEGLRYMVSFLKIKTPQEFLKFINNGTEFPTKYNNGIRSKIGYFQKDLIKLGTMLLDPVHSFVYKMNKIASKANVIIVGGSVGKPIGLKVLLNHHLISEVGNEIAKSGFPSLQLFLVQEEDKMKVVCSLRSLDNLPAINELAQSFGGGGHRNAAGFEMTIDKLPLLLAGKL